MGKLPLVLLGIYLLASIVAFVAYAVDKSAARRGKWRTRESTLHLLSLVGGWPGALLAQHILHHKSRKLSFQVVFWFTVALNCAAVGWMFTPAGSRAVKAAIGVAS